MKQLQLDSFEQQELEELRANADNINISDTPQQQDELEINKEKETTLKNNLEYLPKELNKTLNILNS